jgi:ABC-type nitrate/sulfonate/bicarbonate transport system substrate-binding protein
MKNSFRIMLLAAVFLAAIATRPALAAEKLVGLYSAQVMAQSMPWIAQEANLFPKYNLDFQLVFIAASPMATAAIVSDNAEVILTGGVGIVRAFVQGNTDLAFIAGVKNVMTQSMVAGPAIKRVEDLKGKKIGVSRIGGNTHYFTIQVARRHGLDPGRDFAFIQTGGDPEALAALLTGQIDAATLTPPSDAMALAQGQHYLVYGPELKIPYAATIFVAKRSTMDKRPTAIRSFVRAMAEAAKILHTDREFMYRLLSKKLRVTDRRILDAAYNAEIKALEPRLAIHTDSVQAMIEDVAQTDPRAKKVKAQEMIDTRYLDEMEKSGFFDQLWKK